MKKRNLILSLVISCCFILFLCSAKNSQAETVEEDVLYLYQEETKSLIMKGKGEDTTEETMEGYKPVTYQYAKTEAESKSVTIEDGVTVLPSYFFIADQVYFDKNNDIETVILGKSLRTIEDDAFSYCLALKNIVVDPENPYFKVEEKGLYSKDGKKLYAYPAAAEGEPVILPGTEELAPAVFAYSHMTKIEIPASVTALSGRLFTHCEQLEKITFAENSQCVRTEASYINDIDGPEDAIFSYCPRLTEVRFGENFQKLAPDTFHNSTVRSIYLGKSFRGIVNIKSGKVCKVFSWSRERVYSAFPAIEKIQVSEQNKYFKVKKGALLSKDGKKLYAYPGGRKNTSYTVPASVETIAKDAFCAHKYLKQVHTGKNTKTIGKFAFEYCTKLKKVFLGKKVKTLKVGAFEDCHKLTTIVNIERVKKIEGDVLKATDIIYVPDWAAHEHPATVRGNVMYFYMTGSKKTRWSVIKGKKRVKILKRYKNSARIKVKFKKKGYVVIQAQQGSKKIKYDFYVD